ncbi:MAG: PilN domain-containing protein [Gammaproteobacteria bacterium]|nr:PilN domain-containing protein [Gammaproteobacteria bacterium]
MIRINLLPWREYRRKEQQRQFISITAGAAILMAMIVLYIHLHIGGKIFTQEERNTYLQQQIVEVDKSITEIDALETKKKQLLARMDIIQQLQTRRPGIVHLFADIAQQVPSGIYLTEITQKEDTLLVKGVAQSNARVSALMRSIEASQWLTDPKLEIIQSEGAKNNVRQNQFILHVRLKAPVKEEEKQPS